MLLGHSVPITEAIFTNNVSNRSSFAHVFENVLQNKGLCTFAQDGSILLWDVGKASREGNDLKDLPKRSKMYVVKHCPQIPFTRPFQTFSRSPDERTDFDAQLSELQSLCELFAVARTSMYKLCVSGKKTFYSMCLRDSTVQHWEESPFPRQTVPHASQVTFAIVCADKFTCLIMFCSAALEIKVFPEVRNS